MTGTDTNGARATGTCPLCHEVVVVAAEPLGKFASSYPDGIFERARVRVMVSGGKCLLHHACTSRLANRNFQDEPYWDPDRSWWACASPERPLDDDALFELHCEDCAARWNEAN